jgi:hypothetical protein
MRCRGRTGWSTRRRWPAARATLPADADVVELVDVFALLGGCGS